MDKENATPLYIQPVTNCHGLKKPANIQIAKLEYSTSSNDNYLPSSDKKKSAGVAMNNELTINYSVVSILETVQKEGKISKKLADKMAGGEYIMFKQKQLAEYESDFDRVTKSLLEDNGDS